MFKFMLDAADSYPMFALDRMLSALGVLLRGMLTVFAVLCIVWLALVIIRIILNDIPNRRRAQKESAAANEPQAEAPAVSPAAAQDDTLLVAILSAAVAAYREEEGDGDTGFRVVSFNRTKK